MLNSESQEAIVSSQPTQKGRLIELAMPSLTTYEVLDVVLPSVLMVVIFVATFAVALFGIICKGSRWGLDKPKKPVPLVILEMVDLGFPDLEKQKEKGYDVFGQHINSKVFAALTVIIVPVITSTAFITFWNVYAVEEAAEGACIENFDCFPRMNGDYLLREPVDNCSSFALVSPLNESNVTSQDSTFAPVESRITYNCFRLVFRYAEGFGAAGGILAITALFSKLYFSILVSIRRTYDDDRRCRFIMYTLIWILWFAIMLLFVCINVAVPDIRRAVFRTITDTIQFVMYCLTLVLIAATGVIISIGIEDL